jgi:hypothetical protein
METQTLAQALVVILAAYLPYLWHDNMPTTGDQQRWLAIHALWQKLRPALEALPGGLKSLWGAVDDADGTKRAALIDELTAFMQTHPSLEKEVEIRLTYGPFAQLVETLSKDASPEALEKQAQALTQHLRAMAGTRSVVSTIGGAFRGVASCEVCGKQDASLRVVVYPYVVSMLFMTQRRAYSGLWCRQHGMLRQALASLITLTVGWLGFPFGLMYTPMALYRLALGGDQPADANRRMLSDLANHKLNKQDDPAGAIRCLEAALEFGDAASVRARLHEMYQLYPQPAAPGFFVRLLTYLAVLIGAMTIGGVIGVIDYFLTDIISSILPELGIISAIMSWLPFLAMCFTGLILLTGLMSWGLRATQTRQTALGIALAVVAAVIAAYAIPSGSALADVLTFADYSGSLFNLVFGVVWALVAGGWFFLEPGDGSKLYLIVWIVFLILYVVVSIAASRKITRMYQLQAGTGSFSLSALGGWLAFVVFAAAFGAMLFVSLMG